MADPRAAAPEVREPNLWESFNYNTMMWDRMENYGLHERFMKGLDASPTEMKSVGDAFIIANNANDFRTLERVIAGIVATKTPAQLEAAFREADPTKNAFFDAIVGDTALQTSIHAAISQDPTAFYAFSEFIGKSSDIDREKFAASMTDPNNRAALTSVLNNIATDPALTGDNLASLMSGAGITVAANPELANQAQIRFLETLTGEWGWKGAIGLGNEDWKSVTAHEMGSEEQNTAVIALIAKKSPSHLLDALQAASPDAKPVIDVIRADKDLSTALHAAVAKDPTVLKGLQTLVGPGTSIRPEDFAAALTDPKTKGNIINILNQTAESEDLKFVDLAEVIDSGVAFAGQPGNANNQERYRSALRRFGIEDNRIEMAGMMNNPIGAFAEMWKDPHKFFDQLAETMGGGPAQVAAFKQLGEIMANLVGMFSEDRNLQAVLDRYLPQGQQFFADVTGATDGTNPMGNTDAIPSTVIAPATPAASATEGVTAVSSINQEEAAQFANGTAVLQTASLDVSVGGGSYLSTGTWPNAATGIVPASQIEDFGTDITRKVNNNNQTFDMVG